MVLRCLRGGEGRKRKKKRIAINRLRALPVGKRIYIYIYIFSWDWGGITRNLAMFAESGCPWMPPYSYEIGKLQIGFLTYRVFNL